MNNPVIAKLYDLREVHGSWTEVARHLKVSASYLSDVVNKRRGVSEKFAEKVGCKRVVQYEKVK